MKLTSPAIHARIASTVRQKIWNPCLFFACVLAAGNASGATITWTGAASSYWTNSANWSPPQAPTSADTAVINSGNVTFDPSSQFATLNFNGGNLSGPIVVATNCVMNWAGGRLAQGSSLAVLGNALLNLTTSAEKDLGGPMTNFGHVVLSGSSFYVMNDNSSWLGSMTNFGLWEIQGDLNVAPYWGNDSACLANAGTVRKTTGTGMGIGKTFVAGR